MNKKVLTLCAGFLLAGGLFNSANAIDLRNATPGQYYQLKRTAQFNAGSWDGSSVGLDSWYAANNGGDVVLGNNPNSDNYYWTIETKNNENGVKIVRLVNVHTGKALSVTATDGTSTEWFEINHNMTTSSFGDVNELVWGNGRVNYLAMTLNGSAYEFTSLLASEATSSNWILGLDAVAVAPNVLTGAELNNVYEDGFALQICYQPLKDNNTALDTDKAPVEYADLQGNPFTGMLVAAPVNSTSVALYQGSKKGKRIVLTSDTWGSQAGGTTQTGYKFAAYTDSEYRANSSKIIANEFTIAQPAAKGGAPLEVSVMLDTNNDDIPDTKYELVVTIIENVNRLTVAPSNPATTDVADYTFTNGTWTTYHQNTYVQFGITNMVDYSDFYGKLWNIYKDGKVATPSCTVSEYYGNSDNSDSWIPVAQVAANYPEGQWLFDATKDLDNDGVKEGAFVNRESGHVLSIPNLRYVEGKENTYTKGDATYTISPAGTPSDNYNDGYLAGYTTDQLKQKAFFIGTPLASTGDTVYLAKAANGKLEFSTDKANAVEFRLTMADFDGNEFNADSYLTAKNFTSYTVWKDKNAGTTEQKTDVVNFHQYYVTEAVTGDRLTYDGDEQRFELSDNSSLWLPIVVKHKGADIYNLLYEVYTTIVDTNSDGTADTYITVNNSSNQSFCEAWKLYGAHSANELVGADNAYGFTENDMFVIVDADAQQYRGDFSNTGVLDTIKIFRNDDNSYVLYEKGALLTAKDGKTAIEGFLGMENINDPQYADMHAAMLADTAFYSNTFRPQYMLAVDAEIVNDGWTCPLNPEHNTQAWREENGGHCADAVKDRPYIQGRYLVNLVDSAVAATNAGVKFADNKFVHEYYNTQATPYYRLGFVQAKHIGDSLIIASTNDTINLKNNPEDQVCTFAFRYVDAERDAFTIETLYRAYDIDEDGDIDYKERGYIKYQNGIPVVTPKASEAWVFDLNETSETPTANETIESAADTTISVVATDGAVIVKGAEGKNVIVSTILGKVVANEVLNSDNETIAAPAGIVVVSVDGESFKVAVK